MTIPTEQTLDCAKLAVSKSMATKLSIDLQKIDTFNFLLRPSIELEGAASAKDGKYIPYTSYSVSLQRKLELCTAPNL